MTHQPISYVPPSLARQKYYCFPYYKLNELSENISTFDVIHHADFASLKSLVDMLTGQQEIPADQGGLCNSVHVANYKLMLVL